MNPATAATSQSVRVIAPKLKATRSAGNGEHGDEQDTGSAQDPFQRPVAPLSEGAPDRQPPRPIHQDQCEVADDEGERR